MTAASAARWQTAKPRIARSGLACWFRVRRAERADIRFRLAAAPRRSVNTPPAADDRWRSMWRSLTWSWRVPLCSFRVVELSKSDAKIIGQLKAIHSTQVQPQTTLSLGTPYLGLRSAIRGVCSRSSGSFTSFHGDRHAWFASMTEAAVSRTALGPLPGHHEPSPHPPSGFFGMASICGAAACVSPLRLAPVMPSSLSSPSMIGDCAR